MKETTLEILSDKPKKKFAPYFRERVKRFFNPLEQPKTHFLNPHTLLYDTDDGLLTGGRFRSDLGNINNYATHLSNFAIELFGSPESMEILESTYKFQSFPELMKKRMPEKNIFSLFEKASAESKAQFTKEMSIIYKAMQQCLCLIQSDPLLREMARSSLEDEQIESEEFISEIEESGLPTTVHNHSRGLDNRPGNHGTLQYDEEEKAVRLHLNEVGLDDVRELIHEYAAFLLIRNEKINSAADLKKAKQKNLKYILLILDTLLNEPEITNRYITV